MIVMNCPSCAAEGRIPKAKINTALVCKKCFQTFHVKPSGRAVLGAPSLVTTEAAEHAEHVHEIDHSADVDQWFDKLNRSFHKLGRIAAMLAAVLVLFGLYRWVRPASLEQQVEVTAKALVRGDLDAIRALADEGTSDAAVEWFDLAHPQFSDLVWTTPSIVPRTEILETKRNPEQGTVEVLAGISLPNRLGRLGLATADVGTASLAGSSIDVPIVLKGGGWGGWRLDGKRTLEAFHKETSKGLANVDGP